MIWEVGTFLNRPEAIAVTRLIQHSLLDSSSLGMFLAKLGGYATNGDCIKRAIYLDDAVVLCAYNFLENRENVVQEKFRQI